MEANEKRCSVMACSNPLAPMSAYFCDDHLAKYGRKPGRDDDDEAGSHERADALLAHR